MGGNVIYNVFLFIVIPLLMTLFFADKKSKLIFGFLIIGISVCLLASETNSAIFSYINKDFFYYSTTISPMVEELLKSVPLIFTLFFIYDNPTPKTSVSIGLAIGVGFAIFENIILYFQNGADQTILWSLARGIGAGMMHGLCGGALGFGICFIKNYRKGYFFGIIGILSTIMIYHGVYNLLVQTEELKILGILLPVVTVAFLVPLNIAYERRKNLNEN